LVLSLLNIIISIIIIYQLDKDCNDLCECVREREKTKLNEPKRIR